MKPNSRIIRFVAVSAGMVLLVLLAFVLGRSTGLRQPPGRVHTADAAGSAVKQGTTLYTCSMHPQVRTPNPNDKCPICGMDLIPVPADDDDGQESELPRLRLTARAAALMNIQTWPVERRAVQIPIRLYGRVEYDETRLRTIAAWAAGRLDRLLVDSTGIEVKQGDPMVQIYSPTLIEAQEALLQAVRATQDLRGSGIPVIRESSHATLEAARDRLRLLGLSSDQLEEIESQGKVANHLTIHAPVSGVVTERVATEGQYVETGQAIYTLADLSQLWVNLEAYEADLPWLAVGQTVAFTAQAFPGEIFQGQAAFIQPILDERTRTVRVRVEVPNPEGRLRPGMFVRGLVQAEIGKASPAPPPEPHAHPDSPVLEERLEPHPQHRDADPAGVAPHEPRADDELPLVIPASAPLITGKRAVVYVRLPNQDRPTFEGRDVLLGPRAGDYYVIREGLAEGELVVTAGNFKIDSELQIRGRPSMMAPGGGLPPAHDHTQNPGPGERRARKAAPPGVERMDVPIEFLRSLSPVYQQYFAAQRALANDDLPRYQTAASSMHQAIDAVRADVLPADAAEHWRALAILLRAGQDEIARISGIKRARGLFETHSDALIEVIQRFGHVEQDEIVLAFCPMASEDAGSYWLQVGREIANPYFGAEMLRCGAVRETLAAVPVTGGGQL